MEGEPELVPVSEFQRWSRTAAFPQVPTRPAFRVWRKMKLHPRFDGSDLPETVGEPAGSTTADPPATGGSDRSRETSTRPRIGTDSSATTSLALPSSGGTPRNPRQGKIRERRWRFRPIRELDATNDRKRFMKDDGHAASQTANSAPTATEGS